MATRSSILAWRIPWTEEPGDKGSDRTEGNLHTHTQLTLQQPQLLGSQPELTQHCPLSAGKSTAAHTVLSIFLGLWAPSLLPGCSPHLARLSFSP